MEPISSSRREAAPTPLRDRIIDWLAGQGAGNLTLYMMFLIIVASFIVECLAG